MFFKWRWLLFALLVPTLSGCYLVDGVHFSRSGALLAGVTYRSGDFFDSPKDIRSTNFRAVFVPIIFDPDYEFMMWHKNPWHICGGSTERECKVDLSLFADNDVVKDYIRNSNDTFVIDVVARPKRCGFTEEDFRACKGQDLKQFARYTDPLIDPDEYAWEESWGSPHYNLSIDGDLFIDEGVVISGVSIAADQVYINANKSRVRLTEDAELYTGGMGGYISGLVIEKGSHFVFQGHCCSGEGRIGRRYSGITIENLSLVASNLETPYDELPSVHISAGGINDYRRFDLKNITTAPCGIFSASIQHGYISRLSGFYQSLSLGMYSDSVIKLTDVTGREAQRCAQPY